MKNFLLVMLSLVLSVGAMAQSETDGLVNALKKADWSGVEARMDDMVDLKLLDKDELKNMSRTQALVAFKQFYAERGIRQFDKLSEGGRGGMVYLVGKLSDGNKSYNLTLQLRQKNGQLVIITLRVS
ncbi:MAG: DUF4783 domain-containing protein [Sphingobacteriia bacterium]|nr:MAG: DUF4783 domain-containing protein [Sphingobacteriia bacterium]